MPPKKKPKGRPNRTPDKLTPDVQKVIIDSIAGGVPQRAAAERALVSKSVLEKWIARGKADEKAKKAGPYLAFFTALKKARADRLAASVARIGTAAEGGAVIERTTTTITIGDKTTTKVVERLSQGQWTADAWFLERCHPDEFAGNRREVKELREQLAAVLKAVTDGKLGTSNQDGKEVNPTVGGEAQPKSV